MTSTAEEKAFLSVAVAAIPRVAEIILEFPPDDQRARSKRLNGGPCFIGSQNRSNPVRGRSPLDAALCGQLAERNEQPPPPMASRGIRADTSL